MTRHQTEVGHQSADQLVVDLDAAFGELGMKFAVAVHTVDAWKTFFTWTASQNLRAAVADVGRAYHS